MRVLQVHWTALPVTGGVEVHCAALARQLAELGVDVRLASGTRDADLGDRWPALELGTAAPGDRIDALVEECRAFDVVHWHNPQWHKPEVTAETARRLRASGWGGRLHFDLHNIDDVAEHWQFLADLSDTYLAHSDFVADEVRAHLPGTRVDVLPLALVRDPAPYELPRAARTVALQPTRLTTWKGSDLSLRAALGRLEDGDDFAFVHAGTRNLVWPANIPDELLARIAPWQDRGLVSFVHYSPAQSWRAIEAADVVLHPTADRGTHGEPFSLSVAQAVILGRPVIASESGHLPKLLAGYARARLVPPGDQKALTEALRTPMPGPGPDDPALAHELMSSFSSSGARHMAFYGGADAPVPSIPETRS